ncbi:hypothetical protein VNI00_010910 [Paramarasmius palmivorus]|uniref:Cytochrome P450 n=1 Tax=Paramarasmius palmivorus TaxID=297713 RepID=A0AAW0CEU6_9AGAR
MRGGFHLKAKEYREKMDPIDKYPHAWAKEQIASGNFLPSFTSIQLESAQDGTDGSLSEEQEDIVRWCSSALYVGGADTTVSVMTSFFLMMSLYPDVQKRAQEELHNVVGQERLPVLDDRKNLPYVNALINEVMRWAPPAPLGVPHRVTKEDEYMGYRIPGGATVYANIWAITHDPEVYKDPETFDPTRYLRETPEPDSRKFVFGFGRRVCPGAQFAEDSLFFNIARILSTFDIRKAVDENGHEVEPKVEFTSAVTR